MEKIEKAKEEILPDNFQETIIEQVKNLSKKINKAIEVIEDHEERIKDLEGA